MLLAKASASLLSSSGATVLDNVFGGSAEGLPVLTTVIVTLFEVLLLKLPSALGLPSE